MLYNGLQEALTAPRLMKRRSGGDFQLCRDRIEELLGLKKTTTPLKTRYNKAHVTVLIRNFESIPSFEAADQFKDDNVKFSATFQNRGQRDLLDEIRSLAFPDQEKDDPELQEANQGGEGTSGEPQEEQDDTEDDKLELMEEKQRLNEFFLQFVNSAVYDAPNFRQSGSLSTDMAAKIKLQWMLQSKSGMQRRNANDLSELM